MRLLDKIKDCVLWLLQSNKWAEINLKKEALDRGIDPARLIFMRSCEYSEYLSRLTVADLYLDTFTFNAGAIANDSLWCDLPVLTRQGQSYVARMASSLLAAVDLPECIATSEDGYEMRALELASNTKKLNSIKARLAVNKYKAPLFDSNRFTRNIESAYAQIYAKYFAGEKPKSMRMEEYKTH